HRTIVMGGIVIALFGFVPGFPTAIFVTVGAGMTGGVIWTLRRQSQGVLQAQKDWRSRLTLLHQQYADVESRMGGKEAVRLVLPAEAYKLDVATFCMAFDFARASIAQEYGIPEGYWRLEIDESSEHDYRIFVNQELADSGILNIASLFVKAH